MESPVACMGIYWALVSTHFPEREIASFLSSLLLPSPYSPPEEVSLINCATKKVRSEREQVLLVHSANGHNEDIEMEMELGIQCTELRKSLCKSC